MLLSFGRLSNHSRLAWTYLFLALLITSALSGCATGQDQPERLPPDYTAMEDVCEVVTPDDFAAAMGWPRAEGGVPPNPDPFMFIVIGIVDCQIRAVEGGSSVTVGIASRLTSHVWDEFKGAHAHEYRPLGGVGDEAFESPNGSVFARRGKLILGFLLNEPGVREFSYRDVRTQRLAAKVVERL